MPRKIKIDIADFKQELKFMIDRESDIGLLKAIENIIAQGKTQKAYVKMLVEGARRAEEDIKAGRIYTPEEFKARSEKYLASLYSKAKSSVKKK